VLSVCLAHGRLLAVLDLRIGPQDTSLIGSTVEAMAADYRLLPVALTAADGTQHAGPMDVRLGPGDRLTAFVALSDVDPLVRRERATPLNGLFRGLHAPELALEIVPTKEKRRRSAVRAVVRIAREMALLQ
jgi:hypothetical protein